MKVRAETKTMPQAVKKRAEYNSARGTSNPLEKQRPRNLETPVETAVEEEEEDVVEMVTPVAPRQVTTTATAAVTRLRTRMETTSTDDGNHASGRGGRERGRNDGNNRHGGCRCCRNPTEHGRARCPTSLIAPEKRRRPAYANAAQVVGDTVGGNIVSLAWCILEDITFPAMMEIGSRTPPVIQQQCSSIQQRHTTWCPPNLGFVYMLPSRSTAVYVSKACAASLVQHRRVLSHFVYGMGEVSWFQSTWNC